VTKYLFDTGTAADYINRRGSTRARAARASKAGHRIGICPAVLAELWDGVFTSATSEHNERLLLQHLGHFVLWPYSANACRKYGEIASELRRLGRQMGQNDIQIAATALSLGDCVVVSKDSDLRAVPGLTVEDWSQA
jgi:tRNA(fMet)-specific endonuclease VapC